MPWGPKYDPQYGALVKVITDPKVYLLLNMHKYWISSEVIFTSLEYAWDWVEDIAASLLDKYTTAEEIIYTDHHPNFTLIKYENDQAVYRLEPGSASSTPGKPELYGVQVKRHISDEEAKIMEKLEIKIMNSAGYKYKPIEFDDQIVSQNF